MNFNDDEKKKKLEVLQNFMGYGNPKSNYWFIGIEEGNEWNENNVKDMGDYIKKFNDNKPYYLSNKDMSYEMVLNDKSVTIKGIKRFFEDPIIQNNPREIYEQSFISNILPFSIPNIKTDYTEFYSKLFNVSSRDEYIYSHFYNERLNILSKFILEYIKNNDFINLIFHGKTYWERFKCFIDKYLLSNNYDFNLNNNIRYCKIFNENANIILAPHLSRFTLTTKMINNI